jgi:hypothetical protein
MLPNFLVIGAPKCGTTSICTLLSRHPEVFMSKIKEPHFFGRNDPNKTLEWYKKYFVGSENLSAVGEGSTSYSHPHIIYKAADDIKNLIPNCKLIYIIRDPIKRLESDWKMRTREGWAAGSINDSIKKQETLVGHGMYWLNINVYRRLFPDTQILILFLEDFSITPNNVMKKCFKFLGVDSNISINDSDKPYNAFSQYRTDSKILKFIRKNPYYNSLKYSMPDVLYNISKKIFTKKLDIKLEWEQDLKINVIKKLQDDSFKILEHCRKPKDFWNFT